ncbi:MAG TPA: TIGR01212 family radical SAM protein [Lachnospiraceae bacterium]|nr:TIGR01212 family radical SAM protein [uncultured Lachnoclostridium sp.]HAU86945.1 TIGR01212 family radical SAM protein [Lachnospiraceae bacterium]
MKIWNDKRYYSLDYYLKQTYGEKVYKVSLDGGMTCPNRDGKIGVGGCIFCSAGGSGDFAAPKTDSVTAQIDNAIAGISKSKSVGSKFIAYFQSFTNTYAPADYLRKLFTEAIHHPNIVGLSIATRPDCLPDDVLKLLSELNKIKPVWVELGLQTTNEKSAVFIRRGYPLSVFDDAVMKLNSIGIQTIVHIIVGLPHETRADILNSVMYVSKLPIQGIKLQLLHVIKGTDLAKHLNEFHVLTMDEYIDLVIACLEVLPDHIVVHRITGDGPKDLLLAPDWSCRKREVMNRINQELAKRNTWQGRLNPM